MAKAVTVDFSDSESRGGKKSEGVRRKRYPEGDYLAKCTSAKFGHSGGDKETPRVEVIYELLKPKQFKGKKMRDDLYLTPGALWRLRQTMEAMGLKVPSKKVKVNPLLFKGKIVALTLEDDEYEGKIKSVVADTFRKKDFVEDDSVDDEDEDEEEDEDEDEDEDDESEDEEEDEEEDEDDEEEDDEDDEPEPPKKKAKGKKQSSKSKKSKKSKKDEDEDDDLEGLNLDDI